MARNGRPPRGLELTDVEREELRARLNARKGAMDAAHTSVKDLEQSILDYLARHNEKPRPFVWRKTADQIIGAVGRAAEKLI